jgi:hypothetical protein
MLVTDVSIAEMYNDTSPILVVGDGARAVVEEYRVPEDREIKPL